MDINEQNVLIQEGLALSEKVDNKVAVTLQKTWEKLCDKCKNLAVYNDIEKKVVEVYQYKVRVETWFW